MAYFDRSGEASDEAGRWANFSHLPALHLVPGIAFQPITTDSVMTNFVTFEPKSPTCTTTRSSRSRSSSEAN